MSITWILSANRSCASLFESNWPGNLMRRLQDISHPEGRLQNSEINTDKPGRVFDSVGQARHSTSPKQEPTEHIARQFAINLAELLNKGRIDHAYDGLILIAEPKFLGVLRASLDKNTLSLITQTVNKELVDIKEADLAKYLN